MSSAELIVAGGVETATRRRFAVAWRNTTLTEIHAVGVLDFDHAQYAFWYLPGAGDVPGFRPFIGFPRLDHVYVADRLWPFFALRVMDRRRPDFAVYVDRLGLTPDATVLDILSRSGGELQGDVTVNVIEEPRVELDGSTECVFLVRGVRHAAELYDSADAVRRLAPGDRLRLIADGANPVNDAAVHVAAADGTPLGWVPDLLAGYFRSLAKRDATVEVVRNNGEDAPRHLQLLVRVTGSIDPTSAVFNGTDWSRPSSSGSGTRADR